MKQKISVLLGILSVCLLVFLFFAAAKRDKTEEMQDKKMEETGEIEIFFEPEELVYNGSGSLNLMEGVFAKEDGRDITDTVSAFLTGDGTKEKKKIRYTVFASNGKEMSRERNLRMENYEGPQITVPSAIEISAEDLADLTGKLSERGELKGENGFGIDVTESISWIREKISKGQYKIVFTLVNEYLDETKKEVQVSVSGEVQDIQLELAESSIKIPAGAEFFPLDYVKAANDPAYGEISDRIQVNNMVDVQIPGVYHVVYTLTSMDKTQIAEKVLTVTVIGR